MLLKNKLEKVKSILKSDNVLANLEERYCYAEDASNLITEKKIPDLVVFVETIEDVQKIVKYANEHEIPIISRGAGTNMVGACVCTNGGIVLNFSKMNKILEINPINMTAKVQPGVVLGDLKAKANELGLFYPPDPSNYMVSTVGGSIALSSGGARSFKYGTTKDYVLSLKIVKSDGSLITVGTCTSKSSFGYHLEQLFVGSEGTLGVVVEATLKLIPAPESKSGIFAYFDSIDELMDAVNSIILNHVYPAALDFMDNLSIKTVNEFLNCGLNIEKEYMLLIELDGLQSSIREQIKKVNDILISSGASDIKTAENNDDLEAIWTARNSSFSAATRLAPDVLSDDIIVPRDKLAQMILACKDISKKYSLNVCMVGHVGDANIHPQFVLDLNNEQEFRNYQSAKAEIYNQVKLLGGILSAEHGVGIVKKAGLEEFLGKQVVAYMKDLKRQWDPKNILNPDKIF